MFLQRVEAAVSVMHVERSVRKFLDKFFKEYDLPMPRIKIVNSITAHWLGRTSYTPRVDKNNTLLEIQKSITGDEKTLDRVIAHELIHHWQFITNFVHTGNDDAWKNYQVRKKYGFKEEGHGKDFHEWAAKINAVMGKDYVTEKSDMSYVSEIDKEYFILITPLTSEKFGWSWTVRPSQEQKLAIQNKIMDKSKLFTTKDQRFLSGQRIKKYGAISVPRDKDTMEKLKNLYNSSQNIVPNWPKAS